MFSLANMGRMWVPVDLPTGEGEGAGAGTTRIWLLQTLYTREELRARDKRLTSAAAEGLPADGQLRGMDDVYAMAERVTALEDEDLADLLARTHDWRDVAGDDGKPVSYDAARLRALLAYQWFARAARAALFTASREGVRKNSQPGPGGSPGRLQA